MCTSPRCRGCERVILRSGRLAASRRMGGREQPSSFEARKSSHLPDERNRAHPGMTVSALAASAFEFERDVELGAVGFDLALGIQLQIELDDFGDAKIAERFSGSADGRRGRLFPGILAGADQLNDLVDALSHVVLPFD